MVFRWSTARIQHRYACADRQRSNHQDITTPENTGACYSFELVRLFSSSTGYRVGRWATGPLSGRYAARYYPPTGQRGHEWPYPLDPDPVTVALRSFPG